jgi:hypothetical protein
LVRLSFRADPPKEIVEVVGDPTRQLAQRFEPLRLLQCSFRGLAAPRLFIKALGAPERQRDDENEGPDRRNPDNEVSARLGDPRLPDR